MPPNRHNMQNIQDDVQTKMLIELVQHMMIESKRKGGIMESTGQLLYDLREYSGMENERTSRIPENRIDKSRYTRLPYKRNSDSMAQTEDKRAPLQAKPTNGLKDTSRRRSQEMKMINLCVLDEMGLDYLKLTTPIEIGGFGGAIEPIGKAEVKLKLDQAAATTEVLIVPDKFQHISLIVGQTFTEQLQIVDYKCKIETTTEEPVTCRPYRLSRSEREKVSSVIDELKTAGIMVDILKKKKPASCEEQKMVQESEMRDGRAYKRENDQLKWIVPKKVR
ncbi:hypothetical protein Trydic_g6529 [Trypoxylus dichotomus]